jgi:bla regulator protein blaR1
MSAFAIAVLHSIGWAMLHVLWIGAIIGLFYGLLRAFMPNRIALHYWAGLSALVTLALAACALFAREWLILHERQILTQAVDAALHSTQTGQTGISALLQQLTLPLALLWAAGVLLLAIRLIAGFRQLNAIGRRARFGVELDAIVQQWRTVLGVSERVVIKVSDEILVPCVFGVMRPMLLLPAALLLKIDRTQLELVILHELVHVKRWDAWLNALQISIETALFFHPLVHWISTQVRNDRELLCDQAVLSARAEPLAYARALLNLEEYRQAPPALAIAFNSGQFSERVKRILGRADRSSVRLDAKRSVGAALLSSSLLLLGTSFGLTLIAPTASVQNAEKIALPINAAPSFSPPAAIQLPEFELVFAPIAQVPDIQPIEQADAVPNAGLNFASVTAPAVEAAAVSALIPAAPTLPERLLELDAGNSVDTSTSPRANIKFGRQSFRMQMPIESCQLRTGTRICRDFGG